MYKQAKPTKSTLFL